MAAYVIKLNMALYYRSCDHDIAGNLIRYSFHARPVPFSQIGKLKAHVVLYLVSYALQPF